MSVYEVSLRNGEYCIYENVLASSEKEAETKAMTKYPYMKFCIILKEIKINIE